MVDEYLRYKNALDSDGDKAKLFRGEERKILSQISKIETDVLQAPTGHVSD